jgi:hypothetical protein
MKKVVDFLGSYALCAVLLGFLFVLTFLGTIEQVDHGLYEVQKKYFESLFLTHWVFGVFPVPLPGVYLVLVVLFVNLTIGGLVKIRKSTATVGVIVIHVGIMIMLAAGFVKLKCSSDGNIALYPGQSTDEYSSFYEWEVAIWDAAQVQDVKEFIIPDTDFLDLEGSRTRLFDAKDLPFKIELSHFVKNARVMPKGPMWQSVGPTVDGFAVMSAKLENEAEHNIAALYTKIDGKDGILWGLERFPISVNAGGRTWAVALRKKHFKVPFTITLDKFSHEFYPNTEIPKVYASEVTVHDQGGTHGAKIEMNAPLRDHGVIVFQSFFGPPNAPPGTQLYSGFAVVENPSDQWPLTSCIVIAIGMVIAFGQKLYRYTQIQSAARKA